MTRFMGYEFQHSLVVEMLLFSLAALALVNLVIATHIRLPRGERRSWSYRFAMIVTFLIRSGSTLWLGIYYIAALMYTVFYDLPSGIVFVLAVAAGQNFAQERYNAILAARQVDANTDTEFRAAVGEEQVDEAA